MANPHVWFLWLALLCVVASFLPKLQMPWQVPVILVIVALLLGGRPVP